MRQIRLASVKIEQDLVTAQLRGYKAGQGGGSPGSVRKKATTRGIP